MEKNLVEICSDPQQCAYDQQCKFGYRVEDHAVYCHNDLWDDSPYKCRQAWFTGGKINDEECIGFQPRIDVIGNKGNA